MPEMPEPAAEHEEERIVVNPDVNAVAYRQHIIDMFN